MESCCASETLCSFNTGAEIRIDGIGKNAFAFPPPLVGNSNEDGWCRAATLVIVAGELGSVKELVLIASALELSDGAALRDTKRWPCCEVLAWPRGGGKDMGAAASTLTVWVQNCGVYSVDLPM